MISPDADVVLTGVQDDEPQAFMALRVRPTMSKKRAREWRAWCERLDKLPIPPDKPRSIPVDSDGNPIPEWRIVRV